MKQSAVLHRCVSSASLTHPDKQIEFVVVMHRGLSSLLFSSQFLDAKMSLGLGLSQYQGYL